MGKQQQKPNPKNIVSVGRLMQIVAKNNKDKNDIEQRRKAYGTDMSNPDPEDIQDQIRLDQIEDQNTRYGAMIKHPERYKPRVTVKTVTVKKIK